jgi:predicted RNA binding protein YcfA (HicA-like mRNA interferase family)
VKLPIVSSLDVEKALRKAGFVLAPRRGKGSHKAFYKDDRGKKRLVIVPKRENIPRGTLLSIIDQAGFNKEDFIKLL